MCNYVRFLQIWLKLLIVIKIPLPISLIVGMLNYIWRISEDAHEA